MIVRQFENGKYPIAEYLASHVVNLPTSSSDITKVLSFLEKYADFIIEPALGHNPHID